MKQRILEVDLLIVKDKSLPILITSGIFALLVNVTFFLTYPINVGQSDNPTYLGMIITGSSNLMHASGYPAIVHLLARKVLPLLPPVSVPNGLPSDIGSDWFNTLQSTQFLLHLALFSISIVLCAKVFSISAAAVLTLGWGCSVLFISNVNATAPEWLEGHAVILSVLMHAYARRLTTKRKVLVYCLGAGVFALAYLIKPNSLFFAISLVAFLMLDKESRRFKALQFSCSIAIFLSLTSAYASFYHYKSTGTGQLTFDHAWVLTASLPPDYVSALPEQLGINSLRWAALSRLTRPEYFRAGGIENINYGPPMDIRQRYQKETEYIFRMSRYELIDFVKRNPLPADFSMWLSAVPLYYYYGLEKTDALGIQVYIESLRSHWRYHIKKIAGAVEGFFLTGFDTLQTFPTFADPIEFKFLPPDFNSSFFGKFRIVPPPNSNPYFLQYYNPRETLSFYGVKVIEALNSLSSASFVYIALNIFALPGLFKLKSDLDKITAFSLIAALMSFISASGMLLGLRQKELIAITPVYFLLLSIGLLSTSEWWVKTTTKHQRRVRVKSPATGRRKQ